MKEIDGLFGMLLWFHHFSPSLVHTMYRGFPKRVTHICLLLLRGCAAVNRVRREKEGLRIRMKGCGCKAAERGRTERIRNEEERGKHGSFYKK